MRGLRLHKNTKEILTVLTKKTAKRDNITLHNQEEGKRQGEGNRDVSY